MTSNRTKPDDATRAADRAAAGAPHDATETPTPEEEAAADRHAKVDDGVKKNYDDMAARGAHQQGEGRLP